MTSKSKVDVVRWQTPKYDSVQSGPFQSQRGSTQTSCRSLTALLHRAAPHGASRKQPGTNGSLTELHETHSRAPATRCRGRSTTSTATRRAHTLLHDCDICFGCECHGTGQCPGAEAETPSRRESDEPRYTSSRAFPSLWLLCRGTGSKADVAARQVFDEFHRRTVPHRLNFQRQRGKRTSR